MGLTVEKCLQAWTNSLKQMNAKADIVFFGDSLFYYGDFAPFFPDKVVCNLGLRGDTIQGMINRLEQLIQLSPKVIYLMAGINDLSVLDLVQFGTNYNELLRQISGRMPKADLIVYSMLPVNNSHFILSCDNIQIALYNKEIKKAVDRIKAHFVDSFSLFVEEGELPINYTLDGIHLTKGGYYKLNETLGGNYL